MRTMLVLVPVLLVLGTAQADTTLLDPNLASKNDLVALPGIDDRLARIIIDGRPYLAAADLDALLADSMDIDQREALYAHLFRPVNLNATSDAEILLIPAMSNRMVHEFKEYRPYTRLEQFRREIGKYVDADEVARLESYVTLD